jgi:Fic family protein
LIKRLWVLQLRQSTGNSKDLVEILFMHSYTKIEFLVEKMGLHRHTSSTYLNELEKIGILKPIKIGRSKYFINLELFNMLKKGT